MTLIALIRHGITDWNTEGRAQGQTDIPLNETGRQQARSLAKRFAGEPWDVIATSDLCRAKETAEIIAAALNKPIHIVDERLRETHFGQIEGTTQEERIDKWGSDYRKLDLGAETNESVRERGAGFVEEIAAVYPGKKILIVSHGTLIGQTLKRLLPDMQTEEHLNNTSVTKLSKQDGHWVCDLYNCTAHLQIESSKAAPERCS